MHTNVHPDTRIDGGRAEAHPEWAESARQFASTIYRAEHPAVRVHPETGERALLLGGFALRVVGYPNELSRSVIRTFQEAVTRPENTVRWHWRVGDLAIWDNRSTQHCAVVDYGNARRRCERVTVAGETPVGVDGRPGCLAPRRRLDVLRRRGLTRALRAWRDPAGRASHLGAGICRYAGMVPVLVLAVIAFGFIKSLMSVSWPATRSRHRAAHRPATADFARARRTTRRCEAALARARRRPRLPAAGRARPRRRPAESESAGDQSAGVADRSRQRGDAFDDPRAIALAVGGAQRTMSDTP